MSLDSTLNFNRAPSPTPYTTTMTDKTPPEPSNTEPTVDENRLIAERRAKLTQWREYGQAYPNQWPATHSAATLQADYADVDHWTQDRLAEQAIEVALAGRMMTRRVMGKAAFADLMDGSGARLQCYVRRDDLPEGAYAEFKSWDLGDIIGVRGHLMRTKTGELSVAVTSLMLLSKSLRPLPEKWHGLSDQETRYRQRYVDLIVNPEVRQVFELRSQVVSRIRRFFDQAGFIEVETPMMHPIPGGATARPFVTHHNALDMDLYLRVAPELYLKRLLVGGFDKVYEINRSFRNEGISTRHNPEFTMLEFYWAFADYQALMDFTEALFADLLQALPQLGDGALSYQGTALDLASPFKRLTLIDSVAAALGEQNAQALREPERLRAHCQQHGIAIDKAWGWGRLVTELFESLVEPKLIQPTFITGYPIEVSPLSRRNDQDPELADRFELFIAGREVANGFSELNDPEDQAARFKAQAAAHAAGDQEAMHFDHDYIRALEYGMPPAAGQGIGIDRLVMLLTDAASIRDVLLFPYLRPESTPQ